MGRFYLSYVEQENLLPRSFPPEIPHKTEFPFFFETKSGMFGESCEITGLVSGAPCDIQEPSSKLDYWKMANKWMSDLQSINKSYKI